MQRRDPWACRDAVAVLATMHGKEHLIAPILHDALGLRVTPAPGLDTDRFGTFSHEVERCGTQLDAARAKIAAGFDTLPQARVGIASEGSFGPHPEVPFLAVGRELVLLQDRDTGLELAGYDASLETNFIHHPVRDVAAGIAFARRIGFPRHGVIVIGCRDDRPAPDLLLHKEIGDAEQLAACLDGALGRYGAAWIEADMRAHRNPTRQAAIGRATHDLAARFNSRCPRCDCPGFAVVERRPGLPCAGCGEPTRLTLAERFGCLACGHGDERPAGAAATADPGRCDGCNP